jgi:hypothetical protein
MAGVSGEGRSTQRALSTRQQASIRPMDCDPVWDESRPQTARWVFPLVDLGEDGMSAVCRPTDQTKFWCGGVPLGTW